MTHHGEILLRRSIYFTILAFLIATMVSVTVNTYSVRLENNFLCVYLYYGISILHLNFVVRHQLQYIHQLRIVPYPIQGMQLIPQLHWAVLPDQD